MFSFGENDVSPDQARSLRVLELSQSDTPHRSTSNCTPCVLCTVAAGLWVTDIEDTIRANNRGTTVYKLQKKFQKVFGFTLPLFHGRG